MAPENPFKEGPLEEGLTPKVEGDNFVMGGSSLGPSHSNSSFARVEFRPGETTETAHRREEEEKKKEEKKVRDAIEKDTGYLFEDILRAINPYSETFRIQPDGKLDIIERVDGKPVYFTEAATPDELYQICGKIQAKHPEYSFSFEIDPAGQWLKYTVSKIEKHN